MSNLVDLKSWCDEARRLLSAQRKKQKNNIGNRSDEVLELLNLIKPVPELSAQYQVFLKRYETLATRAKAANDLFNQGVILKKEAQKRIQETTSGMTALKGDIRQALAQQVTGQTGPVKEHEVKGAELKQKRLNELAKLREEVSKLAIPYTDLYPARATIYVQIKKEELENATKGFEELKKALAVQQEKEKTLREKLATLEKLAPDILRLMPVGGPLALGRERLQAGDLKGAEVQLAACEKAADTLKPGTQERLRGEIEADLEELYQEALYEDLGLLLRKGQNCDENGYRKLVKTALKDSDLVLARKEVETFREAIAEARKARPREPINLTKLKEVEEAHGKIDLTGTQKSNVRFARNTEQARSAAVRLVTPSGGLAKDLGALSDMPFAPSNELKRLQEEVGDSEHKDTSQSKHLLKVLKKIESDEKVQAKILEIGAPPDTKEGKAARDMIRATLSLPPDTQITDAHARQAAVAALMNELRQRDVGSCFASSVAIEAQAKRPEVFLEDMKTLFSSGKIVRQRTDLGKKVKMPKAGHNFAKQRGVKEALLAMGIAEGAIGGAVDTAIAELWKTLPESATEGEFTAEEIIAAVGKTALVGKKKEEVDKGVQASKEAFLKAGKVEVELNPDMSTSELNRKTKILPTTKLHTLPTYASALDAMGIPAEELEVEVEAALTVLRKGAPPKPEGDLFTPQEVFQQVAKARKASGKSKKTEDEDMRSATTAFQAQQDNRLLRAWEYSVAGLAEASDEKGAQIRAGVEEVAESAVARYIKTLPKGVKVDEKSQFTKDFTAEVNRLLKERCNVRYDASVSTPPSADGSSSRGVWVLEDKKSKKKVVDKASQDELIRELMEEAKAKFKTGDQATWAEGAANHVKGKTLSKNDPLALSGATESGCETLIAAFNGEPEPVEMHKKTPANGDELFEWLISTSQGLESQIGTDVDKNPEDASLPMYNGPHAFSLTPGSPLLRKAAKGGSPTEVVNEFKEKNRGTSATKFAMGKPMPAQIKKFIEKGLDSFHISWAEDAIKQLEKKFPAKTEISIAEIKKIVEDTIQVEFKASLEKKRKANGQKTMEGTLGSIIDPSDPAKSTTPIELSKPLPTNTKRLVKKTLANFAQDHIDAAIDALEKLAEAGTASLSPLELAKKTIEAAEDSSKKENLKLINGLRNDATTELADGILGATAPVTFGFPLNDPTDGDVKTMIDAALTVLPSGTVNTFRAHIEKRLDVHRKNGEMTLMLPRVKEIIQDVMDVEFASQPDKARNSVRDKMVGKVAGTMTEEPPAVTGTVGNEDGGLAEDLVVKALAAFPGDKNVARDIVMGTLQAGGIGDVTMAQVAKAIDDFYTISVTNGDKGVRDKAVQKSGEEFMKTLLTDENVVNFELNEEPDGELLKTIEAAVAHYTDEKQREKMKKWAIERLKKYEADGNTEVSLPKVMRIIEKTIEEDQKKEDTDKVGSYLKNGMDEMATAVMDDVIPPTPKADLDKLIDEAIKRLGVKDPEAGEVKTEALKAFASLTGSAPMPEITKAVKNALATKSIAKNDEEVGASLRTPGPKGMVFADSNWGTGDKRTMLSMVMNPLTDKMEVWSMGEDGSNPTPRDQKRWVECGWGVPKDANKAGGVV